MKSLGRPTRRLKLGQGLSSHPDTTLIGPGQMQSGTRVRAEQGILRKEEGYLNHGGALPTASNPCGMAVHAHPLNPRLIVAFNGSIYYDEDGDPPPWTEIASGRDVDAPLSAAGKQGITYLANGEDPTLIYRGGSSCLEAPDLPRPEDTPLDYALTPIGILIDGCEAAANWASSSGVTASDESNLKLAGLYSMKCVTANAAAREWIARDFGAGSTIDLSKSDYLALRVQANAVSSPAGDWLQFCFSQVASPATDDDWQYLNIRILADKMNQWILVRWDLNGIAPADRSAVRWLKFQTMRQMDCTFYVDQISHCGALFGDYGYAVTFYSTSTGYESPLGCFRRQTTEEADEESLTPPRRTLSIASNPVYLPEGCDKLRVYRTMAGGSDYYLHSEITPAAYAWSLLDNTPDEDLTEDLRLAVWPGQCPRARWLIDYGDRVLHVGGLIVGARSGVRTGTIYALDQYSEVLQLSAVGSLIAQGVELYYVSGGIELTIELQRSAKGAGAWTTVASVVVSAGDLTPAAWNRVDFDTMTGTADLLLGGEYDWRLHLGLADFGTMGKAWSSSGSYLCYRLLCRVPNVVFVSNLGDGAAIPPLGQDDQPVDDASGGFVTINAQDGDTINGCCKHGSDALLGKRRSIYLFSGYTMDEAGYLQVLPSLGVLEGGTMVDCDGLAVWMAQDRQVYAWRAGGGKAPHHLSFAIQEFLEGLTEAQCAGANALYWARRYYLFLPNAPAGSRGRMYDFDQKGWSPTLDNTQVWATLPHGPDGSSVVPWALVTGPLMLTVRQLFGWETDNGGAVAWAARSKDDDYADVFKDPYCVKRLRAYRLLVDGPAATTVTVKVYRDRSATAAQTYTETIPTGTGVRAIERYPHATLMGRTLSVEISGSHVAAMRVVEMQQWVERVR